ncbi:MAG: DUF3015 domain-containing protein [Oxalobacteraceae bacterium]|nr:DUF3015 domain-containing protein [Oxalobacteraceae bacterium]
MNKKYEKLSRKNMKNLLFLMPLFLCSFSNSASAAGAAGSGPNPYSDCGIGAALFKNTEWAAVISNVIWDLGSTAVTSATVSPETCSKKNVKAAMFIRDAYAPLVEDVARGQGEHLTAALDLFECSREQHAAMTQGVRAVVVKAVVAPGFNEQQPLEKAVQLFNIIDSKTRNTCGV